MKRFTPETERYFKEAEDVFNRVEEVKRRNHSSAEPSIEIPEVEIGALPLPVKKPKKAKRRETGPST